MAVILRYISELGSFRGAHCVKVVEDIPKLTLTALPKASSF